MIALFVSDIDGCLAEPYQPYRLDDLRLLANLAQRAGALPRATPYPALSLCSGRAYPYVEAVSQMLGLNVPVLFESGGGLFDPVTASVTWNPALTPAIEEQLADIRAWFVSDVLPGMPIMLDHAKRAQVGVIGPDVDAVAQLVPTVEAYVAEHLPALRVFHTPVSIDVLPPAITKQQAMGWLSELTDVPLEAMAYIGDSNGDIEALQAVGYGFAPANAAPAVREAVPHVMQRPVAEGVVEAYEWCVAHNTDRAPAAA